MLQYVQADPHPRFVSGDSRLPRGGNCKRYKVRAPDGGGNFYVVAATEQEARQFFRKRQAPHVDAASLVCAEMPD